MKQAFSLHAALVGWGIAKGALVALEFIPTRTDQSRYPAIQAAIEAFQGQSTSLGIEDGVLYYGWPKFQDYEAVGHPVDLALLSKRTGLILIRYLANPSSALAMEADESIAQAAATAEAQMLKSASLRGRNRKLKFDVLPVVYSPGLVGSELTQSVLAASEAGLLVIVRDIEDQRLTGESMDEARSILEGAKALSRPIRRRIEDPEHKPAAVALAKLEEEIAKFDSQQRHVALTSLPCPQRIRGLAGSGKTVILAMKAALAHIENPKAKILVTYYTRSLRDHLTRSITRFFRHFAEGEPDWERIDVQHGWGQKYLPGVYREACLRAGVMPIPFGDAKEQRNPFDYICKSLVQSGRIKPHYDLILIDEGQDFPEGFYQMCFFLAKGARDAKQIIWAYDELQDIFDVRVRTPDEFFGLDDDGQPRISLRRSVPATAETNDFVLPKCYRNQRDILVLAHAIGFGLYVEKPVQMLQNEEHWRDVGYDVVQGSLQPGTKTIIRRPDRNSPAVLNIRKDLPLVDFPKFGNLTEEVRYCAGEFNRFIQAGLEPHDLMAIAIDDRAAKTYLSELASALADMGISSNNIIADRFSEPPFLIEGKVTLSTVYRAKGNEAAVVAVLGCDAIPLGSRTGRNRLFTAFTRTKGWLRVTGIGAPFGRLQGEIELALRFAPELRFIMPDPREIETIQRDLAERDARLLRAREEMNKVKEELGLTDEDLVNVLGDRQRNGRR
jgi:superfamily I DNA and RNA helicase